MAGDAERDERWAAIRADLGGRVRELRQAANLSQEALSLEAGLARSFLVEVEWGKRGLQVERLFDLAEALAVPVEELLGPPTRPPTRSRYRGGRRRLSDGPKEPKQKPAAE